MFGGLLQGNSEEKMEYVYADVQKQRISDNNAVFKPAVVIAADTVVEVDNLTLEKPGDEEDSVRMIRMLSGYLLLLKYCVYVCMYVCMYVYTK